MANKKRYRIYCNTCAVAKEGWTNLDDPPSQCPTNPAHNVNSESKAITEVLSLDNLIAITDPTVNDDINDGYAVGSRWINTQSKDEFVNVDNTAGTSIWTKTRKDIFGSGYQYAESLGLSSSNATSWQNKLILDLGSVTAGLYLVCFYYETNVSKGNFDGYGRVIIDDDESKVIHNNIFMPWNSSTAIVPCSGVIPVLLTAAAHHVDIEYKSSSSQNTVGIQGARVSVWRAS